MAKTCIELSIYEIQDNALDSYPIVNICQLGVVEREKIRSRAQLKHKSLLSKFLQNLQKIGWPNSKFDRPKGKLQSTEVAAVTKS